MAEHTPVKPEKVIATAAAALADELVIPMTFQRSGIDAYKGAKDDTINIKVPGTLPFRTYGWRNDRSTSMQFDTYSERKYPMSFGDDIYSGVALTDEQATMDGLGDWNTLVTAQVDAVGNGLEWESSQYLQDAPYAVTLGVANTALRAGLVRARATLNAMRLPKSAKRYFVCGTDWESALLNDDDLNLAQNVGEAEAVAQLREATIGRRYGFDIVVTNEVDPKAAFAYIPSAFVFLTAAPAVPKSAGFGATASFDGIALRWVKGFVIEKGQELSVVSAYKGFQHIKDPLIKVDANGQRTVSTHEHFVRGISLVLDGTDNLPVDSATRPNRPASITQAMDAEFIAATGISA